MRGRAFQQIAGFIDCHLKMNAACGVEAYALDPLGDLAFLNGDVGRNSGVVESVEINLALRKGREKCRGDNQEAKLEDFCKGEHVFSLKLGVGCGKI